MEGNPDNGQSSLQALLDVACQAEPLPESPSRNKILCVEVKGGVRAKRNQDVSSSSGADRVYSAPVPFSSVSDISQASTVDDRKKQSMSKLRSTLAAVQRERLPLSLKMSRGYAQRDEGNKPQLPLNQIMEPGSTGAQNDPAQAVVGAALDALVWNKRGTGTPSWKRKNGDGHDTPGSASVYGTEALRRRMLTSDLAAWTSELIATSACCGPTGLAKEKIKAELLKASSENGIGRDLASILRRSRPKSTGKNRNTQLRQNEQVLRNALELASASL